MNTSFTNTVPDWSKTRPVFTNPFAPQPPSTIDPNSLGWNVSPMGSIPRAEPMSFDAPNFSLPLDLQLRDQWDDLNAMFRTRLSLVEADDAPSTMTKIPPDTSDNTRRSRKFSAAHLRDKDIKPTSLQRIRRRPSLFSAPPTAISSSSASIAPLPTIEPVRFSSPGPSARPYIQKEDYARYFGPDASREER